MAWQDTLAQILDLSAPMVGALGAPGATPASVVSSLQEASRELVSLLKQSSVIEDLLSAAQALQQQFAVLVTTPNLGPADLQRLAVLSASAYVLSGNAVQQADSDEAILLYTLQQMVPWLQRLADLALLVVSAA